MPGSVAGLAAWSDTVELDAFARRFSRSAKFAWTGSFLAHGEEFGRADREDTAEHDRRFDPDLRFVGDLRLDNRDALIASFDLSEREGRALSDISLFALGWNRLGERLLDAIVGPYAVAIWSERRRRLTLVRDPQGLRPLFFYCAHDWVAFASLPVTLADWPEIGRRLNRQRLVELLLLIDPQDNPSFLDGIEAVRKGEIITIENPAKVSRRRFWHAENIKTERRSPDDHAAGLRACLMQAVCSAVPPTGGVASMMSGGFDSTIISSLAANVLASQGRELLAYTAIPTARDVPSPSPIWFDDESALAALVAARHPNMRHKLIAPTEGPMKAIFDFFYEKVGVPITYPHTIAWWEAIQKQALADGASVLLTASWGNRTISYNGASHLDRLAENGQWVTMLGWLLRLRSKHVAFDRRRLLTRAIRRQLGEAGWEWLRRAAGRRPSPPQRATARRWSPVAMGALEEFLANADFDAKHMQVLHGGLGRFSYRSDWMMREHVQPLYEKAVALNSGLELRDPTLDRRVVEFSLSIPDDAFLHGGQPRAVFRRAFASDLPPEVLANERIGRQGYGTHERIQSSLAAFHEEIDRVPSLSPARDLIDLDELENLVNTFPQADSGNTDFDARYYRKLTRGLGALHFINRLGPGN